MTQPVRGWTVADICTHCVKTAPSWSSVPAARLDLVGSLLDDWRVGDHSAGEPGCCEGIPLAGIPRNDVRPVHHMVGIDNNTTMINTG